ncbi:MAG: GNAT family N-acetyltransferase [FCB group bacterium]|nr:GNAT family N-acetyltransferase [FCB group bacterium]
MRYEEITHLDYIDELLSIAETYPRTDAELKQVRKQLLNELAEAGHNRYIYIGYLEEKAVAMVQIIINNADNDPDLANGEDVAHAHNLQVRNELQGQGIGKQMMAFIEDKAREMGKETLTLGVDDINERAIRLYKNIGYQVFKVEEGRTAEEKCFIMKKSL